MTDSLITAVSRFLTPEVIGKMASATGLDSATAQKATDASVPAILGGLADLVSKPGGARQLTSAIGEQPSGLLSNLTGAIGGNAQLQDKGGSMLASLLGGGTLGTLVSNVAKSAGIGEGSARSLLGLLTPVILGVLGREQRTAGMEASGLARMLTDQKDQIAAALPAGLSGMLGKGVRDSLGMGASHAEARIRDAAQAAYGQYRSTGAEVQRAFGEAKSQGGSNWAYWALPLLALGGFLWYLLQSGHTPDPAPVKTTSTTTTQAPIRIVPTTQDKSFYFTKAALNGWAHDNAFRNQDVYNRAGEKIGVVKNLLVAPDGKTKAAIIGVGQFLGIGEKNIAVPLAAMQVDRRDNNDTRLILDVAKDTLRTAPGFDAASTR